MLNRWDETEARRHPGLDELVYRSLLIGAETNLVVWGGGNTSTKLTEKDFRGREVKVLRVKGSGSDLRSIERRHFPGVRLDDVLPLRERAAMSDEEMVEYLSHCLMEPSSGRPSIETLLHAFVPYRHIDHSHADAILSLTNNVEGLKQIRAVYGQEVVWIPYRRPGFALSRQVAEEVERHPKARGCVLEKHGLITWGETSRDSYQTHIELNTRAEEYMVERTRGRRVFGAPQAAPLPPADRKRAAAALLPVLRGALAAAAKRVVLRFEDTDDVLEFAGAERAAELSQIGPATPDHLMNTRILPLLLPAPILAGRDGAAGRGGAAGSDGAAERGDGAAAAGAELPAGLAESCEREVRAAVARYADQYRAYFQKNRRGDEPMQEPAPRVVLVRGVGMITAGRDARAARVSADIYHHTIRVMAGAEAISRYASLDTEDAYDVEYWPMELYKLTLALPEKELARRVALLTGAGAGIGAAIARRLAEEGAHVVITDLDAGRAESVAAEIRAKHGAERALALGMDVTREEQVRSTIERAVLEYGGLDIVVNNAGIARAAALENLALADWEKTLAVNATGHFLVARESLRVLRRQGSGGALLFVGSKNVLAPGKDFAAYSAAKAAQTQLARIAAIEAAEYGVRVNILAPDAVFRDSGLWSEEIRRERARAHGIAPQEIEAFYRERSLLKIEVRTEDVADAALFLVSERSSRTTGCILTVDGGLREAFPR